MVFFFFFTHIFFSFCTGCHETSGTFGIFTPRTKKEIAVLRLTLFSQLCQRFATSPDVLPSSSEDRAIKVGTCQHNRMSTKAGHFCIVKCSNGRSNPTIKGNSNGLGPIGRVTFAQESICTAQTQMKIFDISVNRGTSISVFMMLRAF